MIFFWFFARLFVPLVEDGYKESFKKYYYSNITELIKDELSNNNNSEIYSKINGFFDYGFCSVNTRMYDLLKYLTIKYFMDPTRTSDKNISELILHDNWYEVHYLLNGIVRPWYQKMTDLMSSNYSSYMSESRSYYIIIFVVLLLLISLYYWIGWKHYEDEFIDSIQKSFDLINLIPEEIKNIIIKKLNEN